ncbi:HesB/IscA family protein [Azospirillum sp.]|uniref:HesB/IscA family protein n=1 Tax=Azospirillum sp. TaxID=34012 RepID=UPI003D7588B7
MVTLTQTAVATLETVLAKSGSMVQGLRIAVTDGGCAGLKYQMGLEAEAADDDEVIAFGGVRVFVDPHSAPLLDGVVVDFVEGIEGAGFTFDNPKASSCGCGKSFSVGGSCSSATAGAAASSCGTSTH